MASAPMQRGSLFIVTFLSIAMFCCYAGYCYIIIFNIYGLNEILFLTIYYLLFSVCYGCCVLNFAGIYLCFNKNNRGFRGGVAGAKHGQGLIVL